MVYLFNHAEIDVLRNDAHFLCRRHILLDYLAQVSYVCEFSYQINTKYHMPLAL